MNHLENSKSLKSKTCQWVLTWACTKESEMCRVPCPFPPSLFFFDNIKNCEQKCINAYRIWKLEIQRSIFKKDPFIMHPKAPILCWDNANIIVGCPLLTWYWYITHLLSLGCLLLLCLHWDRCFCWHGLVIWALVQT